MVLNYNDLFRLAQKLKIFLIEMTDNCVLEFNYIKHINHKD